MPKRIEKSSSVGGEPQTAEGHPTREEIELRAYQIYLQRGGVQGQEVEDWLQAERELLEKQGKSSRLVTARAI